MTPDEWMETFTNIHEEYIQRYPHATVSDIVGELVTHPIVQADPDYDFFYAMAAMRAGSWDLPSALYAMGYPHEDGENAMHGLTVLQRRWLYEKYGHGPKDEKAFMEGDYDKHWDT